jgi:type II secretory pathway pseudopilin PulG
MKNRKSPAQQKGKREAGFSLVELLFAAAIFTIIGAATLELFAKHQPIFNQQQNLAEVNIGLRNAIAQMQLDISNAGANYYPGINIPNYPVGVVVKNRVVASGTDCRTGTPLVYGTTCFDSFTIVTGDKLTPPTNPSTSTGGCVSTKDTTATAGDIYLGPSGSTTGYASAAAATAAASNYKNGDQLLLVNNAGSVYTTIQLSADATTGTVNGNTNKFIKLPVASHSKTDSTTPGLNASGSSPDPYDMTTTNNNMLGDSFCSTDWVVRLKPIQYSVDLTDPTNPTLTRTIGGVAQNLSQKTLATQIIGFKVGVSLFNNVNDTDTTTYQFDNSSYNNGTAVANNFTLVRSVMVSLIGRTKPVTDPTYKFRNSFDSGAYEVQGVTVVVNPRNMSMAD